MLPLRIAVLEGDETGQELLEQSLRILDPDLLRIPLELESFDLSLESRRATGNRVVFHPGDTRSGRRQARGLGRQPRRKLRILA